VPPLAWLVVAILAGLGAYLVGWRAWQGYRGRESRDDNTERYLAWRGRADRGPRTTTREGMTGEERRRIYGGAGLAAIAVIGLLAFFATS
jgi:hypothetical protein